MGDGIQVQVNNPLVETSISGPIGINISRPIREKIWAGS